MAYVITAPCVDVRDKSCLDVCPVDCIYEGSQQLFIHPEQCIDCQACEPVCPVDAIYASGDVPDKWKHFIDFNAQFFRDNPEAHAATK